jgi:hypothetical protein
MKDHSLWMTPNNYEEKRGYATMWLLSNNHEGERRKMNKKAHTTNQSLY